MPPNRQHCSTWRHVTWHTPPYNSRSVWRLFRYTHPHGLQDLGPHYLFSEKHHSITAPLTTVPTPPCHASGNAAAAPPTVFAVWKLFHWWSLPTHITWPRPLSFSSPVDVLSHCQMSDCMYLPLQHSEIVLVRFTESIVSEYETSTSHLHTEYVHPLTSLQLTQYRKQRVRDKALGRTWGHKDWQRRRSRTGEEGVRLTISTNL